MDPDRELLEARITALRELNDQRWRELERRLDQMNEFREQLEGERRTYLTVARYDEKHSDLERRLGIVERFVANATGRFAAVGVVGGIFIAVVASVVTRLLVGNP